MCAAVSEKVVSEVFGYLREKKRTYENISRKFEEKYGGIKSLEEKINREGVPEEDHTLWDDLVEWGNVTSEIKRLDAMLRGLHGA